MQKLGDNVEGDMIPILVEALVARGEVHRLGMRLEESLADLTRVPLYYMKHINYNYVLPHVRTDKIE